MFPLNRNFVRLRVAILLDTKGPEIRSGFFANGAKKIELKKGETITLTTDYEVKEDTCTGHIDCQV